MRGQLRLNEPHACFLLRCVGNPFKPFNQGARVLDVIVAEGEKQLDTCNVSPIETIGIAPSGHEDSVIPRGWDVTPPPKGSCSYPLTVHPTQTGDIAGGKKCGNCRREDRNGGAWGGQECRFDSITRKLAVWVKLVIKEALNQCDKIVIGPQA
jgi:hypothetical protein